MSADQRATAPVRRASALTPGSVPGLGHLLPWLAARWSNRVALVTSTRTLTYSELDEESDRIAAYLAERGVRAGDRVSLLSQNRWEWLASYHAVLKVGGVVNPLNVMSTGPEAVYMMNDCGAAGLLASAERLRALGDALREIETLRVQLSFDEPVGDAPSMREELATRSSASFTAVGVDPASLASIAYTSGTTGHPKGVMQSQQSLVLNSAYTATMHGRTAEDVVVTALPSPHVYGNVVTHSTLMAGGRVVLEERFDPADALHSIAAHRATMFEGVPAMFAMMLTSPALDTTNLSSLTRCTVGGQTIADSVVMAWEQRTGSPLIEVWGMTEISGLGTTHAVHAPNVHGSIGTSYPGIELRVANLNDPATECPAGERGELMIRGPVVFMGYYNNENATTDAFTADGWLRSGDVATHDGAGRYFVVDRMKELILTGGYNVYPAEIERVMMGHESVAFVAVKGQPDDVKGEVAHAYVVLAPGYQPDREALLAHCRADLAAYKVPRVIHYVSSLPTTSSGKLVRRKLGEQQLT